jgi:DNA-binding response OmpR family regulator
MPYTVLVVDDQKRTLQTIETILHQQHYTVVTAETGLEALKKIEEYRPDLVVLDVALPDIDGMEVCKRVRNNSTIPILIMTGEAKDEFDRILGLELGADDYLCKPFHLRELIARIKSLLRRVHEYSKQPISTQKIEAGEVLVDPARHEVQLRGEVVDLTPKEFELLRALAEDAGAVVPRESLLRKVWGSDNSASRTLSVHIQRLRTKIEPDPNHPTYIITIPGVGYKLAVG